jgi:NadR type nicotinamide-nucleotide adenylyltransferase
MAQAATHHPRRIALLGPESSGKTWLVEQLSATLEATAVYEYARDYLAELNADYSAQDLIRIAQVQFERNRDAEGKLVICDTEMVTMYIWCDEKLGFVPDEITSLLSQQAFDLYILCRPDIPWVHDPMRENEHDRDRLFEVYQKVLAVRGIGPLIFEGDFLARDSEVEQLYSRLR